MATTKKPAPAKTKPAAARRKAGAAKQKATRSAAVARRPAPRADLGAPIDGFFAKQPPHLGAILVVLRALVEEAAPDAESSIKWGMPFYTIHGTMMCALGGHRSHVRLVLSGPADAFPDPAGLLEGESANGRHLKLTSLDELPRDDVRRWLRVAADLARGNG